MKPTLLVLAAGMGSRYGALKQMDGVGPNNEAILDYSIYDAKRAGFGKVVFVIRKDFADAFKKSTTVSVSGCLWNMFIKDWTVSLRDIRYLREESNHGEQDMPF